MIPQVLCDETMEVVVAGGSVVTIRVEIYAPSPVDSQFVCDYKISSLDSIIIRNRYGATALQAILLTLKAVADEISGMSCEEITSVDSGVWDDLKRLRTTDDEWRDNLEAFGRRHKVSDEELFSRLPPHLARRLGKRA